MAKGRVSAQELKRDPLMQQYISTSTWVRGRSKQITTWATAIAVVVAVAAAGWLLFSRRAGNAAESLAEAFRYHEAIVANPIPANRGGYAFTTEDEKHRKSFEAFQKAANDYPSYHGDLARFYAATHQLFFEPAKAEATLKELSQKDSDIGAQARLALAERYEVTGKFNEAVAEYQKLKASPFTVPAALIDLNLARTYEAMGKNKEAVDLYFSIAKDKDWRTTAIGTQAVTRLTILDPEKADQLPPAEAANPFAGLSSLGGSMVQ